MNEAMKNPIFRIIVNTKQYKAENNPVLEYCKGKTSYEIMGKLVKDVYEEFCELYPNNNVSNIEFSRQIKKHLNVDVRVAKIAGKSIRVYTSTELLLQ